MKTPKSIESVIDLLASDKHLVAECPNCSETFKLCDSGLFYGDDFTPDALEFVKAQQTVIKESKDELKRMKEMATKGAAKKSTEVNFGKVLEKVAPALDGFPFARTDCRPIFEPIDYLVFNGWSNKGKVEELCFVDIKTGNAKLNNHQKQVKAAVEKGDVELQLY